jgi:hypothetical protein
VLLFKKNEGMNLRVLKWWETFDKSKTYQFLMLKVKIKESSYRPGVAQRVSGGLGSQISMTFGTRR